MSGTALVTGSMASQLGFFADDLKMYAQILKPVDDDVLQTALNRLFTLSQKKTNCYPLTHHT